MSGPVFALNPWGVSKLRGIKLPEWAGEPEARGMSHNGTIFFIHPDHKPQKLGIGDKKFTELEIFVEKGRAL